VKIQGLLFDLGGTLFSYAGQKQMGNAIFEAADALGLKEARRNIGSAWRTASESVMRDFAQRDYYLHRDLFLETLQSFAGSYGLPVPKVVADRFHALQRAAVIDHLPIRADCLDTLRGLKSRGVYLSIVSNIDDDYLDPLVEKHGLDEVLDHWTSSEEAQSCKPHSAIYHYALEKAGLGTGDALFVGDSLQHDIAGASSVGLRSARIVEEGITTPLTSGLKISAQPDYEISELSELVRIVESLDDA